jgi:hypothetical protein
VKQLQFLAAVLLLVPTVSQSIHSSQTYPIQTGKQPLVILQGGPSIPPTCSGQICPP